MLVKQHKRKWQAGCKVTLNLARGEAKVILNEVNSANPSRLKGYVEVAGKKQMW